MINEKKILALIPARGGSKGIKDKNIYAVNGKPLISYTIEAAQKSKYIDKVLVSTDSIKIKNVSEEYGAYAPFLRPDYLATDDATTIDAVIHAINYLKNKDDIYDYLILLQPTSPLRTNIDIDAAVEKFVECGEIGLASISEVNDSPILIRKLINDELMENLLDSGSTIRRQDMPSFFRINGSIYINKITEINEKTSFNDNKVYYLMNKEHSIDIDEYVDLEMFKYYLNEENKK